MANQTKLGWRPYIVTSPVSASTLLTSLYSVWNADTSSTTLGTSVYNVWNGELLGTTQSNSLDSGVYLNLDGVSQSSTIDTSIYGVWNGDGNANDSVGTNHGTLMNGSTFSTGKTGNAFLFDGVNDYVRLPDNSMNLTGDFTISAWIYLTGGGPQTILSNEYYSGTTIKGWGIYIDNASIGQTNRFLQFAVYRNTTSDFTIYQASLNGASAVYSGLTNNAWSHISIVRKSGVDTFIYVNGERVNTTLVGASASRTVDPLYNTTQYVTIGADVANSSGTAFSNYLKNGSKIDGLSVWNRALNGSEITLLFNNSTGVQYPYSSKFSVSRDLIGSGSAAMVNGATHSTGYIGTAISLDGVNDYYQFPDNIIDPIKNEFSISFWIKANGTTGFILSEMTTVNNDPVTPEYDRGIVLYYYNSGNFDFKSGPNGSDFSVSYNLSSRYAVGYLSMTDWNHMTLTYKQGSAAKIYFNGTLVASTSTANALTRATVNSLRIGRATSYYNGSTFRSGYFNGSIDGFTIWNREITQAEVNILYNGKNPNIKYPYSNKTLYGIYDSVASVNGTYLNASRQGILMVNGKLDKSFQFDGSSSISIPDNSLNTLLSGDFSVGFWVYPTHANGGTVSPFTYTSVALGSNFINGFEMRFAGWSPKFIMYNNTINASSVMLTSSTNMVQNTWNHVVITRKRGTRSKFYLNGELVASNTSTSDPVISGTFIGNIGHNKMSGFNYILAAGSMMDGITTWTKELSDDEVTQLYNMGGGIQYPFTTQTIKTPYSVYNGDNLVDPIGAKNATINGGVTYTTGKIGNAYTFDGTTGYLTLPVGSLNLSGSFSFSMWLKFNGTPANFSTIISNSINASYVGFSLLVNSGNLFIQLGNGTSTWPQLSGPSVSEFTNKWGLITFVWEQGVGPKFYLNGVLYNSATNTSTLSYAGITAAPMIGKLTGGGWAMLNGSIDGLTFWNSALSLPEISTLHNEGNGMEYPYSSSIVAKLPSASDVYGTNTGTLMNGCTFTTGKIGKAFTFDGVNDYLSLPNNSLSFVNDFSVSFWINPTFTSGIDYRIIGTNYYAGGTYGNGWQFARFSNNNWAILISGSGTSGANFTCNNNIIPNNTWSLVTITRKKSTSTKIYVNGTDLTSQFTYVDGNSSINPTYTATQYCQIGANKYDANPATGFVSNGTKIDGLSVWQKELTQAEITELYNSGNGKQYPNF